MQSDFRQVMALVAAGYAFDDCRLLNRFGLEETTTAENMRLHQNQYETDRRRNSSALPGAWLAPRPLKLLIASS
jgi:hypothetical protein